MGSSVPISPGRPLPAFRQAGVPRKIAGPRWRSEPYDKFRAGGKNMPYGQEVPRDCGLMDDRANPQDNVDPVGDEAPAPASLLMSGIAEGLRGMRFMAAVKSGERGAAR